MMEVPHEPARASSAERTARLAVVFFLGLALLVLAFGLGFGVKELTGDNSSSAPSTSTTSTNGGSNGSRSVGAAVIDEIVNILQSQYVDRNTLSADQLKDAAISGIINSLNDRETSYISPADLGAGALQLNATYEGIGASVSDRSGAIQIISPFRDSPAEKAGIRAGDIILEVDGEPTDGWTDTHAVEKIRGPRGTSVSLKVKHTDNTVETLTITRGDIDIQSVFTEPNVEVIPGESGKNLVDRNGKPVTDIAYVAISQFHEKTDSELQTRMRDAEAKGYKGIILDLRSNPGGGLQATVDVADEFLNSGTIITEVDSSGKQQSTSAKQGGILTKLPIVVLQDKGSASGAEVLAAALRDNGRATIIGTQSFGKGTVNRLIPLKSCGQANCGAVYIAIGRWLTPKGQQIEGVGITPDIELPMTYDEYLDQGDIQVFKAIDVLRGQN
jgi:carboxyl-terminal processing protease